MHDQLPDLLYPCVFELARACQLAIGRVYCTSLAIGEIPSLFESVPPPASQPGAMLAVETLNGFVRSFGRVHHERFHQVNKGLSCTFRPDQSYSEIHVSSLNWRTLNLPQVVRTSLGRYGLAFAAGHRRDIRTLAAALLTTQNSQPIERLAHDLCCSPSTLRRHVKAMTGRPPIRIRTHRRLLVAIDLLRTTPWKVEAIAAAVGWKSAKGMYLTCNAILGLTPAQIRALPADTASQLRSLLQELSTDAAVVPSSQRGTGCEADPEKPC